MADIFNAGLMDTQATRTFPFFVSLGCENLALLLSVDYETLADIHADVSFTDFPEFGSVMYGKGQNS